MAIGDYSCTGTRGFPYTGTTCFVYTHHADHHDVGTPLLLLQPSSIPALSPSSSLSSCPMEHSTDKLNHVVKELWPILLGVASEQAKTNPPALQSWPCHRYEDTIQYRCRCHFQILCYEIDGGTLQYATREQHQPIPLPNQEFPMANRRIQNVMRGLMEFLNKPIQDNDMKQTSNVLSSSQGENDDGCFSFHIMRQHLTSASFASSWYDDDDDLENNEPPTSDCAVTLHYNQPILNISHWQLQACMICDRLHLTQLTGRSKGQVVTAKPTTGAAIAKYPTATTTAIRDVLWLQPPVHQEQSSGWKVQLGRIPANDEDSHRPAGGNELLLATDGNIPVYYYNHETAFCHPNARVMCHALEWMLNRIQHIVEARRWGNNSSRQDENNNTASSSATLSSTTPPVTLRLVELYSGNGAHTMALAKSGLLNDICAVELDDRLVQACHVNLARNNVIHRDSSSDTEAADTTTTTPTATVILETTSSVQETTEQASEIRITETQVHVIQGDAGAWARKTRQMWFQPRAPPNTTFPSGGIDTIHHHHHAFDILLVDPPRQGLDTFVCQWALDESNPITDVLYISCGHQALARDLNILLSSSKNALEGNCQVDCRPYQVVDCQVLDLFPQTSAVETLVHLSRQPKKRLR